MSSTSFASLPLSPAQFDALTALGYERMTPVQAQSLPLLLQGKDVIARARTGSGKTAAFGIGLLQAINPRFFGVQALVLCPTRELAEQVSGELRRLASRMANIKLVTLCGGKPFGPQVGSLEHGSHIVVGTPGRIQDHLQRQTLDLGGLQVLVLDEADRMLDMGFAESMENIILKTPKSRQTLLFSATYPENIRKMSAAIQRSPTMVTVDEDVGHAEEVIEQIFYEVNKHERNTTLLALFEHYQPANAVVFCNTKKQCDEVTKTLQEYDIEARAIHGDLEQRERDQVLVQFSNESCAVLVATDVAARGLDIKALAMVINYELPRDPQVYVHRIGRTGRAGETGLAMSIVIPSEAHRIQKIEEFRKQPCACDTLPSLDRNPNYFLKAPMVTVRLDAGRKQKLRPGDVLGALTKDAGLEGAQIGKISIFERWSFVALKRDALRQAMNYLANGKVKGRSIRARKLR